VNKQLKRSSSSLPSKQPSDERDCVPKNIKYYELDRSCIGFLICLGDLCNGNDKMEKQTEREGLEAFKEFVVKAFGENAEEENGTSTDTNEETTPIFTASTSASLH
jgi:hypothetical protein